MPTYRITYWPPYDRKLIEDVDAEYADREGEHRLVLRSWVIVVHEARLVVARRVDRRGAAVELQLCRQSDSLHMDDKPQNPTR